jgi:hypothetical protein
VSPCTWCHTRARHEAQIGKACVVPKKGFGRKSLTSHCDGKLYEQREEDEDLGDVLSVESVEAERLSL